MTDPLIHGRTPEEIKRVLAWANYGCGGFDCDDCSYQDVCSHENERRAVSDALAYIQHLEAQQPKWISVKERLPEAEEMYIVYIPLMGEVVAADYLDGHWIDWEVDLTEHVTHWMPLPEPPKEETHETTD